MTLSVGTAGVGAWAAGVGVADVAGTGLWVVPALLPDRLVPQALQNLLPSGICVPQLGQNMGASRHRRGAGFARAARVDRRLRFYIPAVYNGQVPHPARTPTEVSAVRPHAATHPMSSSAAMGVLLTCGIGT